MKRTIPVLLGLSLGLVGCGGGGGGGSNTTGAVTVDYDGPSPTTVATVADKETADDAVKAAVAAVSGLGSTSSSSYKAGSGSGAPELVLQMVTNDVLERVISGGSASVLVGATQPEQCPGGGTVTMVQQQADPNTVSSGDYAELRYDHCFINGFEMHGVMRTDFTSAYGEPTEPPTGDWGLGLAMDVGFYMKADGIYMAMDGGYSASVDFDYATSTTAMQITGDRMAMELNDGTDYFVQLMSNFDFSLSEDYYTEDTTAAYSFTVTNNIIGGSVTVKTTEDFATYGSDQYPHAGTVVVTADNGSGKTCSVRVTVDYTYTATVSYDLDGDGIYGNGTDPADKPVAWSEL